MKHKRTACRCRTCRARKTLPRHPLLYRNRVICKKCGERNPDLDSCANCKAPMSLAPACQTCGDVRWTPDKHRNSRRRKPGELCHCDGVWFSIKGAPHRAGTKGCKLSSPADLNYTSKYDPKYGF